MRQQDDSIPRKERNVTSIGDQRRLVEFGVTEVDDLDKSRFYQAPGGQVFRLAPQDGGI